MFDQIWSLVLVISSIGETIWAELLKENVSLCWSEQAPGWEDPAGEWKTIHTYTLYVYMYTMYIVHTIHVHTQCVCVYVFSANTCAYTIVYVCVFAVNKHTHSCKIKNALFAGNNNNNDEICCKFASIDSKIHQHTQPNKNTANNPISTETTQYAVLWIEIVCYERLQAYRTVIWVICLLFQFHVFYHHRLFIDLYNIKHETSVLKQ